MTGFLDELRKVVAKYTKAACMAIDTQWQSLPKEYGDSKVWEAERRAARDCVAMSICAAGQRAWIAEYGRGSKMVMSSKENPFLDDYISGRIKDPDGNPLFNKERLSHALAITGRTHGYYYDLDGNRYHSHGTLAGQVIESLGDSYKPVAPKHIIEDILFGSGGIISDMYDEIQNVILNQLAKVMKSVPKEIVLYDK